MNVAQLLFRLIGLLAMFACACVAQAQTYDPFPNAPDRSSQRYPSQPQPAWNRQQQQLPPPVNIQIQNIPQETQVWCWAAVAQQIILATKGAQATPPQCALVARAYGQPVNSCCGNTRNCTVTGQLPQIQGLIAEFGGRHSSIEAPTDPMTVYNTLASGKAIILAVKASPFAGHVVVLRGMAWMQTPYGVEPVLMINDPMAYFTQPVPFSQIARFWMSAIVVS